MLDSRKFRFAKDNGFFPCNEQYRIIFESGAHRVISWECDEIRVELFVGSHDDCLQYVENRYVEELENSIG